MLDYGFEIGEEVIDIYGRKGEIVGVCDCDECKKRGFYEPVVKWRYKENEDWITAYEEQQGFPRIHSIRDRIFNPFNEQELEERLKELKEKLDYLLYEMNCAKTALKTIKGE